MNQTIKLDLFNKEDIDYMTKNIDGKTWLIGSKIESEKQKNYYYAINCSNNLYTVRYDDFGSGNLC